MFKVKNCVFAYCKFISSDVYSRENPNLLFASNSYVDLSLNRSLPIKYTEKQCPSQFTALISLIVEFKSTGYASG